MAGLPPSAAPSHLWQAFRHAPFHLWQVFRHEPRRTSTDAGRRSELSSLARGLAVRPPADGEDSARRESLGDEAPATPLKP